jgi:S-(hydroxymethyl)glutathione dehydrogenase/alcohol dehydrogenase
MRAAVVEEFGQPLVVREVEPLELGSEDVRVEVRATSVCHSDLSALRGQYPLPLPMVIGHEGAGVVTEVGADVSTFRPGDKVIGSFVAACGTCWQCVRDRSNLCERFPGIAGIRRVSIDGAASMVMAGLGTMAEQMTAHQASLVGVQTDLPFEELSLIGCGVTTGLGSALWTTGVTPGSTAAVWGLGGVGLSALQGCVIAGAARVIAVDTEPAKLDLARKLGATDLIDASSTDAVKAVRELTDGRGADFTFEVVGDIGPMRQAYDAACRGGSVTFVGAMSTDKVLELPANDLHSSNKRLLGSLYGSAQVRRHIPQIVALAEAGRLDLGSMISARRPLAEVNEAFDALAANRVVRTVLIP